MKYGNDDIYGSIHTGAILFNGSNGEMDKGVKKMKDLEHPVVSQINSTGYVNMVAQPEHWGIDYFGGEILMGDEVVEDPNTGAIFLKEDLERYLSEVYGFEFKTVD